MPSQLKKAGFIEVGRWELDRRGPTYTLDKESGTFNVLYAFVSGRRILYVGKTTATLENRMYQYQRPGKSQRTNIRVSDQISRLLANGSKIRILALPDPGNLQHKGFHLDLAAGIEGSVIKELQPEWNIASK